MGAIDINPAVRIRALQAMYAAEHAALTNWGHWSMDRGGMAPRLEPPGTFREYRSDGREEGYGEVKKIPDRRKVPAKPEPPEKVEYDELAAVILDERMHGPGGLAIYVRYVIKTAYCTREVPDDQFPSLSGCTLDAFCERLEGALKFVSRFCK